ncbi:uncharacterized protein LOC122072011 isoform X2 [Macadamia integrifolia]|uniref:uncharacterized protein LOC122072011 isoform X2 n=1 Tax=Macadamia integrifolia TaxID=60698 RepID=UPI001C4F46B9|nr:uncharacterized protein LOC122072011 isoform X2 [Macadamia integrifolia]
MACLSCSIEMEPKTLNQGQLNNAMEAAADIVQKMKPHKASNVFIEGLRPVAPISRRKEKLKKREKLHSIAYGKEHVLVIERSRECSCSSSRINKSPEKAILREPLSAPF